MVRNLSRLVPKFLLLKFKKIILRNNSSNVPYFNRNYYLEKNIDILVSQIDPLEHYLQSGQFENRDPARTISSDWIQYKYSDNFANPFEAVIASAKTSKELSPNPLFDPEFYLTQIDDSSELQGLSSYEHFLAIGLERGLKPNRWLDLDFFAISNPWFFNSTKSHLEKFTNIFEIIRKNMFFDPYLCFVVEDSQSNKYQLTKSLIVDFLNKSGKAKPGSKNEISGWYFADILQELSELDFEQIRSSETVRDYPPRILAEKINLPQTKVLSQKVVFYCHWDPNNTVAAWIETALKAWKNLGFQIVFNTNVSIQSLPEFVEDLCLGVINRSNSGHDFESHSLSWSWIIRNSIKPQTLVITNDSIFFPVSGLTQLRKQFDSSNFDFWALTENTWSQNHLQSYLVCLQNGAIKEYFSWIDTELSQWKYISKIGLINKIELYSHNFAQSQGITPQSLFSGADPTFKFWDELISNEIPILKVHTIRNLITKQSIDPTLLNLKLSKILSESAISVEAIIDHARYMEMYNPNSDYLYT